MKLTVLVDNHTYIDRYFLGEPAVCYLIEDGDRRILLDTGYSDVFIENAVRMGIDLSSVTDIVLSHGHNDHTGGLPAFFAKFSQSVRLFAHPNALLPKHVQARLTKTACSLSEHVLFLGEIPRVHAFEQDRAVGETPSVCGCCWESDALADDTSLALVLPDGVFVVTGCAHAGVCNTVAYAKEVSGKERVLGVLGGFHLFESGGALDETIATLRALGVERVYPAHCTSLAVKSAFFAAMPTEEVGVGLSILW